MVFIQPLQYVMTCAKHFPCIISFNGNVSEVLTPSGLGVLLWEVANTACADPLNRGHQMLPQGLPSLLSLFLGNLVLLFLTPVRNPL